MPSEKRSRLSVRLGPCDSGCGPSLGTRRRRRSLSCTIRARISGTRGLLAWPASGWADVRIRPPHRAPSSRARTVPQLSPTRMPTSPPHAPIACQMSSLTGEASAWSSPGAGGAVPTVGRRPRPPRHRAASAPCTPAQQPPCAPARRRTCASRAWGVRAPPPPGLLCRPAPAAVAPPACRCR